MSEKKYTSVGGQAVIEGVMMRGVDTISVAVRKPDGEIELKVEPLAAVARMAWTKWPIFRGIFGFFDSLIIGMKALMFSAEFFEEGADDEPQGKFDLWVEKTFGDKADQVLIWTSVMISIGFVVLFFMVLPVFVIGSLRPWIHNGIALSALEGALKLGLFVAYILVISRMKEIRRVFEYHGAEHKVIHCFESGKELTVENARSFTTLHPRCGTSFLLIVMVISILVFSLISWNSVWIRVAWKLVLLPLVAGLSYELLKWSSKKETTLTRIIKAPGMAMQKLTTREPDDRQLEVALAAMKAVVAEKERGSCFED